MASVSNFDFWFRQEDNGWIGLRAISDDAKEWVSEHIAPENMVVGSIQYIEADYAWIILEDLLNEGYVITSPRGILELVNA